MADLDAIYNAYNEIKDAGENAPQHSEAYSTIIAASQGSDNAKRLAAQFIPAYFKLFPALHNKAIDGFFDLCEDESTLIRQSAIKSLPSLCKDGPQYVIKIADVLCQLLQLDEQDLPAVQGALETLLMQSPGDVLTVIFRQGVKGPELRERSLDFITDHVITARTTLFKDPAIESFFLDEVQKAMGSVSNSELEVFARILMQTTPYQTGTMDFTNLLSIYISHIGSEKPFDARDPESIKRVLVAGKLSMPLFKKNVSAEPFLEFFAVNILPVDPFNRVADKQKTSILRLYADALISGHANSTQLQAAGKLLADIIVANIPSDHTSTGPIEFSQVECLTNMLYFISTKFPDVLDNEELALRFRTLYVSTQNQISTVKPELASASSKIPQDPATVATLSKSLLVLNNIYRVVKEFMRPKTMRSIRLVLRPSWKPQPTPPAKPAAVETNSKPSVTPSNASKGAPGAKAPAKNVSKAATKAIAKPGSKPAPTLQQAAVQKRKADQEPSSKPKKAKILRRPGSGAGNTSPGGNSPGGHGNKGQKQNQQHGTPPHASPQQSSQPQAHAQQHQQPPHARKGSTGAGHSGRGHSSQTETNRKSRGGSAGRISFLKR